MSHEPDHLRRKILLAGLTFGLITPAQITSAQARFGDEAQVNALLATGGLALRTSVVALQRSPNPDVRSFARSEIAEQRQISAAITGSPRPAVPLGPRAAAILAEAESLPGGLAFDRVYVRQQIDGHRQLLALARTYAATGADPEIAAVAQGALPLIRLHLSILRRLDRNLIG